MAKAARDKQLDELKLLASMKAKFEQIIGDKKSEDEKKLLLDQYMLRMALNREIRNDSTRKAIQETSEVIQNIEQSQKEGMRHSLQQHNIQSYIMEMEPRFANLGKLITSLAKQLAQQHVINNFAEWRAAVNRQKIIDQAPKPFDKPIDVPDLQYFAKVNEDGTLTADFVPDFIKDFIILRDDKGQPIDQYGNRISEHGDTVQDKEKAEIFQQAFQEGIEQWLHGQGYCVHKETDGYRIYPQAVCHKVDEIWVLNEDDVKQRYDEPNCDRMGHPLNNLIPRPNARLKPGQDPLYLQPKEFDALRLSILDKNKSLGHFLEQYFDDLTFVHSEAPSASPRMM